MTTILIYCGKKSVKKMKFPQVRREVIVRLSRKEMVIEENRTMDITVLSPSAKIISRSIIWQD